MRPGGPNDLLAIERDGGFGQMLTPELASLQGTGQMPSTVFGRHSFRSRPQELVGLVLQAIGSTKGPAS